ncbi:DNA translocase FtsK [Proteinivorax tanatarense]|uniref:DNA translocase FtsK n=1 Tax=Proteinivorax tanatarense TaxID=1260629 RepID=A0AAU7VP73_9FIRM
MKTRDKILSKWITKVLFKYFNVQSKEGTPKIFIKISGLLDRELMYFLDAFKQQEDKLASFYNPVVRLIKPMDGYEDFSLKEHETSIWLRNNTQANEALIILVNETTPEAQSLENLFSIDEAFLLSHKGLKELYEVLSEEYRLVSEEIDDLKKFYNIFSKVSEPQLRTLIEFIAFLIESEENSIVKSIQKGLPILDLFVDDHLMIEDSNVKRLRRNFALANLISKNSNIEKLKDKMYTFLDNEERNKFPHDIWKETSPENFREMALNFINKEDKRLLKFNFEVIEEVFNFREKTKLKDRIKDVLEYNNRSTDEKSKIDTGIETVEENEAADDIQEFYEEFENDFEKDKNLKRIIIRRIEKLRHPSEYDDIYEALLYEAYGLLSECLDEQELKDVYYELSTAESRLPSEAIQFLDIYVQNIQNQVPLVRYKSKEIEEDNSIKFKEITFELRIFNQNSKIKAKSFKIVNLSNSTFSIFVNSIKNAELPKIIQYKNETISKRNIADDIGENINNYVAQQDEEMKKQKVYFQQFCTWYSNVLKKVCTDGIFSISSKEIETQIDAYFKGVEKSVHISQQIFKPIVEIGTYDICDYNPGSTGLISERTISIFNPIRLISYLKRYEQIQNLLEDWINRGVEDSLFIEKEHEYLDYVADSFKQLSPRYFALDSDSKFLIEISEVLGEGKFVLNNELMKSTDYISTELSEELVKTAKNYLDVYPYSKDSLDILFLYCQSADIVIKSIEQLFKKIKNIKKLRLNVHSLYAGEIHKEINDWVARQEEYSNPNIDSKFPSVEVKILSGNRTEEIFEQIDEYMVDTDIVVLADYFGQSDQVQFSFEKIAPQYSENWFEKVEVEPLKDTEAIKRLPYISEKMPNILKYFYKMQYMIQKHAVLDDNDLFVLKNTITINNISSHLIDKIHEKFNWIMIMDRFLDKSLLQKTSSKAQIIQYRSKAGKNKNYKLILSSSKHIKKLNKNLIDYGYHDRLLRKAKEIMKNENVKKEAVLEAVRTVKEISGALVLKAVGPGKYAHEMLATYLSIKANQKSKNEETLEVWSLCDELPWFNSRNRRPDLVVTTITNGEDSLNIQFSIKELKFVNDRIFEKERIDAIKQISSAETLYKNIFSFESGKLDAAFWKDELVHYLVERAAYNLKEANLIKALQDKDLDNINVSIDTSIDVFCYTSNMKEFEFAQGNCEVYEDILKNKYKNYIYPRNYILKALGTTDETEPDYTELRSNFIDVEKELFEKKSKLDSDNTKGPVSYTSTEDDLTKKRMNNEKNIVDGEEKSQSNMARKSSETHEGNKETHEESHKENERTGVPSSTKNHNRNFDNIPEITALKGLELSNGTSELTDYSYLKRRYANKLTSNFTRNNIEIDVEEVIIGPGVIRIVVKIPSTVSQNKITSRRKDIQLWLETSQEPNIKIARGRINIDIVREDPDTIYFEQFMAKLRNQVGDQVKRTNLIAPLGFDPLSKAIFIDLSDATTPHLLVGGTTGSGKSVSLNSIILGVMCLYSPQQVQFVFIDPKQVEFTHYENKQHTSRVITDIEEAVQALDELVDEMEKRYKEFAKEYVSNIDEYVELTDNNLPHLVIVFDEFADFMNQNKELAKRVENSIMRLGQKARAAGIHLIICTQHPKADVINTNIRNNLGARLALRTADSVASHVILDQDGAERLAGKGDFLAKVSYGNIERGKSPFLTPKVKRALLKYFERS